MNRPAGGDGWDEISSLHVPPPIEPRTPTSVELSPPPLRVPTVGPSKDSQTTELRRELHVLRTEIVRLRKQSQSQAEYMRSLDVRVQWCEGHARAIWARISAAFDALKGGRT